MTRPSRNATKSTEKNTDVVTEDVVTQDNTVPDDTVAEVVPDDNATENTPRIPPALAENMILGSICTKYVEIFDEISAYNKLVLAEKSSEWTPGKLIEKAREFASPEDASKVNTDIKAALDKWEALMTEVNKARTELVKRTAQELGISIEVTAARNPETEGPLREKRKVALEIGSQLSMLAKLSNDESVTQVVNEFLENNPLPAIGRDQARTFGNEGKSTPKYRVTVTVSKDGTDLFVGDGFTKTALALPKPVFGYERGKSLTSDRLREAWEAAGNSSDKTVVDPVVFEDNGLTFSIKKK